jgi:hypothetical protein
MKRRYVDIDQFKSRNMAEEGNIDFKFWYNKSNEEKIRAAGIMTAAAFNEPDFFKKKVDRTVFSARKHKL